MKRLMHFLLAAILFISIPINALAGQAYAKQMFFDVKETDWFYNTVSKLVEKGHVAGYTDGTFKPHNNIRVSEFTKILVSALDYKISLVKGRYWAEGYINKAGELGIIKDGEFDDYERYITRGEMARMIVRAGMGTRAEEKGLSLDVPENYTEYASMITDYSDIEPDLQEIALKVFTSGIITGLPDGSLGFDKNATRAEASTIIIRFLEKDQRKVPELPEKLNSENDAANYDGSDGTGADEDYGKIIIDNGNNSNLDITVKLKEFVSYEYPHMGREHILGPEKTVYYAIYYGEDGKVEYGEIIRQADDFVLERVYPDGTYVEFTPPQLTEKQKQDFIDKYDPDKVKERILEEQKERERKSEEAYRMLIKEGFVIPAKGDNYVIDMYTKSDKEVLKRIVGTKEVNYGNTFEKEYDFNVETVRDSIIPILDKADLTIPLRVSIVPYQCEDYPQGVMGYSKYDTEKKQYEFHIVLFNNKTPMKEQFNTQFKEYLKEIKEFK